MRIVCYSLGLWSMTTLLKIDYKIATCLKLCWTSCEVCGQIIHFILDWLFWVYGPKKITLFIWSISPSTSIQIWITEEYKEPNIHVFTWNEPKKGTNLRTNTEYLEALWKFSLWEYIDLGQVGWKDKVELSNQLETRSWPVMVSLLSLSLWLVWNHVSVQYECKV